MARSARPTATTPHLGTVVLGLILLGVAAAALLGQARDGNVDWAMLLPYTVFGAGALLVGVGLIAQVARRRHRP